jgi:hypothetical protein
MCRPIGAILLWAAFASTAFAQSTFRLEGQVTSGLSLFPPLNPAPENPYFEYGQPVGGYPVDFIAELGIGPVPDAWSFDFTVIEGERTLEYAVGGQANVNSHLELMVNVVTQSSTAIAIEFRDHPLWSEMFLLDMDLATGTGTWQWQRDCPVCDLRYPLPSATATILAVQLVPEPAAPGLALIAGGLGMCVAVGRRRS